MRGLKFPAIIKKSLSFLAFFLFAAGIVFGAGFYKNSLKESGAMAFSLQEKAIKPVVYDFAGQGLPKKIVQPGKVTISTGHGTGIVNKSGKPVLIQVSTPGFNDAIDVSSTDNGFDKSSGKFTKPVAAGKSLNLTLTFDIPRENLNQRSVSRGAIVFVDSESGDVINTLPVDLINSSVK